MNEDLTRLVSNGATNKSSRVYGLDILRFLLAVEILMFHSRMHIGCSYGRLIDLFLSIGAVTMTAFFVLSGFVNEYVFGEMQFHEKGIIKKFYLRRLIGILPSYYLTAILYLVFLSDLTWSEWLILLPIEVLGIQSVFSSLTTLGHNGGTVSIPSDYMIYSIVFLPIWMTLIVGMSEIRISNVRLIKLIRYLGTIAYDMFLVQFFVWSIQRWIDGNIQMDNISRIICVFILCIGLATLMNVLFEKPIQKKLRRLIENAG